MSGLIILLTRLEKHVYFTYFIIPLFYFRIFLGKIGFYWK